MAHTSMNTGDNFIDLAILQNGSDIRGVAIPGEGKENANLMKRETIALTRGFAEVLKEKVTKLPGEMLIAVGCDSRLSGPYLKDIILDTLSENGYPAIDCGLASTPAMFMSTQFDEFKCDGSIMVTASHLPLNRNGFKYFDANGGFQKNDIEGIIGKARKYYAPAIGDEDREEMLDAVKARKHKSNNASAYDSTTYKNPKAPNGKAYRPLMDVYAEHLRTIIVDGIGIEMNWNLADAFHDENSNVLSGLSVCIDAGNGAGGFYASKVLDPLDANTKSSQYLRPDGRFPNHVPNPENDEAMGSIKKRVTRNNADLGIIFDTDVDRSGAVAGDGKEISRNRMIALAAALVAEDYPESTIVTDSITSTQLTAFLEDELGLKHLRYKRGYKNVINKALELEEAGETCPLAIETSGHAALKENYFLDDGAYLATKIIIKAAELKKEGKTLSDLLEKLEEPAEAKEFRMNITCEDFAPYGDKILEELKSWATEQEGMTLVTPNYEGVRIDFGGGWCLLRKSLHDPVMPMNIESDKEGGAEVIKNKMQEFLKAYEDLDTGSLK